MTEVGRASRPRAPSAFGPARPLWEAVYRSLAMAMLDAPADWPPTDQQGGSGIPMLLVVGDRDTVTPVDQVRSVARRYPHAELLVVPGAGHLQAIKVDRHTYTTTVLDFLARALGGEPVAASRAGAGAP
jgi:pimeloyl-ACP methyl ester carboxylesterase